jgi:hypothetical protein
MLKLRKVGWDIFVFFTNSSGHPALQLGISWFSVTPLQYLRLELLAAEEAERQRRWQAEEAERQWWRRAEEVERRRKSEAEEAERRRKRRDDDARRPSFERELHDLREKHEQGLPAFVRFVLDNHPPIHEPKFDRVSILRIFHFGPN